MWKAVRELQKEKRKERDEDTIQLKTSGFNDEPVMLNVFPEPVGVVSFPGQSVRIYQCHFRWVYECEVYGVSSRCF